MQQRVISRTVCQELHVKQSDGVAYGLLASILCNGLLQSSLLLHSVRRGTGSGIGCYIMNLLQVGLATLCMTRHFTKTGPCIEILCQSDGAIPDCSRYTDTVHKTQPLHHQTVGGWGFLHCVSALTALEHGCVMQQLGRECFLHLADQSRHILSGLCLETPAHWRSCS